MFISNHTGKMTEKNEKVLNQENKELIKSLSASEVAALLTSKPSGTKEMCVFGEIFHERFSFNEYKQSIGYTKWGFKKFCCRLAAACREAGLDNRWIKYGIRLAAAFIAAGAEGRTPPTEHVELAEGVILHAKPDLVKLGYSIKLPFQYIELKTQPATQYDRVQCAIFGLALETEIILMSPKDPNAEWIEITTEEIQPYPDKEKIINLIKMYGTNQVSL